MPIIDTLPRNAYTATAGQTIFPYKWPINEASEIRVYYAGALLTLNTAYTVTGVGSAEGNVILTTGALVGTSVVLLRRTPLSQEIDYIDHNPFPAAAHEGALDKLTRITQQLQEELNRAPRLTPSTQLGALTFPDPGTLPLVAGGRKALVWNTLGTDLDLVEMTATSGLVDDLIASSAPASLPLPGTPGRLRSITGGFGGVVLDTGTGWLPLNTPVLRPEAFPGADIGVKINNAVAALPSTGGIIDARGFIGLQTASVSILINKPCHLLLGAVDLRSSAAEIIQVTAPGSPVSITGLSDAQTSITQTGVAQTGIAIRSDFSVDISYLTITSIVTATSGQGIYVDGDTHDVSSNGYSTFSRLSITRQWIGINTYAAMGWTADDCFIVESRSIGIHVQNVTNVDTGDSTITRCIFNTSMPGTTYAIHQVSSGGLRVMNNKILGHSYAFALDMASGGVTGDLLVTGNSIENQTAGGLLFTRVAGSGSFFNIVIVANQFALPVGVISIGPAVAYSTIMIAANLISCSSSTATLIAVVGNFVTIYGNYLAGGGGTTTGINIAAGASFTHVGDNTFNSVTTPVFDGGSNTVYAPQSRSTPPGSGEVNLLLQRNVAGVVTVAQVTMGAADSGGAGFKLLRVPN